METSEVARSLESLSSPVRLEVLLILIRAGKQGVVAGEIANQIGVSPTNLSFHLRMLAGEGFVSVVQEGRFLRYSLVPERVIELVDFLSRELRDPAKKILRASSGK